MVKVRFAPSPTGYLHVGNIRTALINWLFARKVGGEYLLRIDDTDDTRSRGEYERAIYEDMEWLGLGWDSSVSQSSRMDRYEWAKQKLIDDGRLYPCYETAQELEFKRKMQVSQGKPPIYDRAALRLSDRQRAEMEAEGRRPHWRFKLEDVDVSWHDLVRGECEFKGLHASDPVLFREDGVPLYTISSVVDDGEMGITHIVRGEDHVSNSAVQVQIFEALGFDVPQFAHTALLTSVDGKLSKREGGGDIRSLRERGFLPLAINSLLARIGTSDAVEVATSMQELVASFDFGKFSRSAAMYDEEELRRLNVKLIHVLPLEEAEKYFPDSVREMRLDREFWEVVRVNISSFDEIVEWWELVNSPITPKIDSKDSEYCRRAAELLPECKWGDGSWREFIATVKKETGRKGKELFMPLRLALTARSDGPDLSKVFALLGREKAYKRLMGEVA